MAPTYFDSCCIAAPLFSAHFCIGHKKIVKNCWQTIYRDGSLFIKRWHLHECFIQYKGKLCALCIHCLVRMLFVRYTLIEYGLSFIYSINRDPISWGICWLLTHRYLTESQKTWNTAMEWKFCQTWEPIKRRLQISATKSGLLKSQRHFKKFPGQMKTPTALLNPYFGAKLYLIKNNVPYW